jgi:hypothetical protein
MLTEQDLAILMPLGFALQWARSKERFKERWTFAVAAMMAAIVLLLNHHATYIPLWVAASTGFVGVLEFTRWVVVSWGGMTSAVLGGTFAAHAASHKIKAVPKFKGGTQ